MGNEAFRVAIPEYFVLLCGSLDLLSFQVVVVVEMSKKLRQEHRLRIGSYL